MWAFNKIFTAIFQNLFDVGIEYDEEEAVDENRQQRKQTIQEAFDTKAERERVSRVSFSCLNPYEPPHGKTNNLHRRKQRRRSASQ